MTPSTVDSRLPLQQQWPEALVARYRAAGHWRGETFPGFLRVYEESQPQGKEERETHLPDMNEGEVVSLRAIRAAGGHVVAQDEASAVVNGMPGSAIAAGIGLFLAIIALQKSGVIVGNEDTLVALGPLNTAPPLLALAGCATKTPRQSPK